ncbi:hypothetical protein NEOKW01_0094 [Nematocida sp. AWRm80]|nr:hypothetical protein NEOKW01_0094 [Nematocida sp. AWRm80]
MPSLLEVFGAPGSGRNSFCLSLTKEVPSLWIEAYSRYTYKRAQQIGIDLSEVHILRVGPHEILSQLESESFERFIQDKKVKIIVINTLTDYSKIFDSSKVSISLLTALKRVYLKYKTKSIFISDEVSILTRIQPCMVIREHIPKSTMNTIQWISSIPAKIHLQRIPGPDTLSKILFLKPINTTEEYILSITKESILISSSNTKTNNTDSIPIIDSIENYSNNQNITPIHSLDSEVESISSDRVETELESHLKSLSEMV